MSDYACCPRNICKLAEDDPKHRRGRASLLIEYNGSTLLIDTSADFREQMLRERVKRLDAVVLTHEHADHIGGIPDTRSYSRILSDGLPLYGSAETIAAVHESFSYAFNPTTYVGGGIPSLNPRVISESVVIEGLLFTPIPVIHGASKGCYGYRFGDIAYIPDAKSIPAGSMELLHGLDLLIIDCLRLEKPHDTHLILPEVLAITEELQPKRVLATHMAHGIHYKEDKKLVPDTFDFAYDGMRLEF